MEAIVKRHRKPKTSDTPALPTVEVVRRAAKSDERRREIVKNRVDASKRVPHLHARGLLPGHTASAQDIFDDNDIELRPGDGDTVVSVLERGLVDLSSKVDGTIGHVLPSTLASLLLMSLDAEFGCELILIPSKLLTIERVQAHVDAMGLGLGEALSAQVARRLFLSLLNSDPVRSSFLHQPLPSSLAKGTKPHDASVQPTSPPTSDAVASSTAVEDEAPVRLDRRHLSGRQTKGYAQALHDIPWGDTARTMVEGACAEILVPTQQEADRCKPTEHAGERCVVWWDGKPRAILNDSLTRITRATWLNWCKSDRDTEGR
jgi:hypothetical protein